MRAQIERLRKLVESQSETIKNLEARSILAASPAILDLYMWLSYRSFKAKGTESIPIFGEFGLANQLGCVDKVGRGGSAPCSNNGSTPIRPIWPHCPARIISNGKNIEIRNATPIGELRPSPPANW